ncbi:MAG TPA: hypothetical protein VMH39_01715, partial [Gemmatimonadaceae bacterium]|nr:hypothetical protein [Gemmatimonadaceae bacterium]
GQFLGDAPPIAPLPAVSDLDVETVMAEWNVISDIRWIPLVVPLLGAATACVPFLICWSVLVPHG